MTDREQERWRVIPGFDDFYEVSDFGRVRSYKGKLVRLQCGTFVPKRLAVPRVLKTVIRKNSGYEVVGLKIKNKGYKRYVHRLVAEMFLDLPGGMEVDHRDTKKSNNHYLNLRPATHFMNAANQPGKADGTSRFKGVYWNKARQKWQAACRIGGKQTYIGRFACEVEAARAYDAVAIKEFGGFAFLNFKSDEERERHAGNRESAA